MILLNKSMFYSIDISEDKEEKNPKYSIFDNTVTGNETYGLHEAMTSNFPWLRQIKEDDESLFEKNNQQNLDLNIIPKVQATNIFNDLFAEKIITKPSTSTGQTNEKKKEKKNIMKTILKINFPEPDPPKLLGKIRGRKKKENKDIEKSEHGKFSEDNMMRKIKSHLMDFIINILNESLKEKDKDDKTSMFCKIDKDINEVLKRDYNLQLLGKTLSEIFSTTKISKKYKNIENEYSNAILIQKIFEQAKEIGTIRILQMRFGEIINQIRDYHMKTFLDNIKKKEIGNHNINVVEYINSLEKLFRDYEKWFSDKKGRNRDKNSGNKKSKKKKSKIILNIN